LALRLLLLAVPMLLLFSGCRSAGSYGGGGYAPGYAGGDYEEEAYGGEAYGEYDNDGLTESPPMEAMEAMEESRGAPMAKRQSSFGANKERAKESRQRRGDRRVDHRQRAARGQRIDNQVVLRVPAARLHEVIALVAELGVVDYRLLEALDVTAQYTDLESRIRVLEQMQIHLEALLKKAESVEQALEIRRALDEIMLELESARTHMRELAKSVAFSTLILRLVERGPTQALPTNNDPFPWVDELGAEATSYR
jgi:chemotaxis protein histidine kinase CheA